MSVSSAATQLYCRKLKHWLISNLSTWSCSSKSWETDLTRVLHLDSDNHTNDNIAQANCATSFARAVLLVRTVVQQIVNKKTSASISNILGTYKNFMCNLTRTPSWVAGSILLARNMKWLQSAKVTHLRNYSQDRSARKSNCMVIRLFAHDATNWCCARRSRELREALFSIKFILIWKWAATWS